MREDVRLFISNSHTETVSYDGYRQTLEGVARQEGLAAERFTQSVFGETAVWGKCIHHREAPEALAAEKADVAVVYYHLALRYTRIFPDRFDFIPLGGTRTQPVPGKENRIAEIHMGRVGDGGPWGDRLLDFMQRSEVARIYAEHGLVAIDGGDKSDGLGSLP